MSSTPHVDELRRLVNAGNVSAAAAYHKENKDILLEEAQFIQQQRHEKNTEKEA